MATKRTVSLEEQYQLFLQRMGLNELEMHPQQKRQLKQTFYGAFGQCLVIMRDEITRLPEDQAIIECQDMFDQVGNFFLKETQKHN